MTEIIEPNPLLIEYLQTCHELPCSSNGDLTEFFENDEWHYIQSDLETNIFLLKRLDEVGILPNELSICDLGIGLGTILFDIYLQSKEFTDRKFKFTGIEKYPRYIDCLNENLIKFWNNELTLIQGDIMDQDLSKYNFVYFYTPFRVAEKMIPFFLKVINETPIGGIIVGLDEFRVKNYSQDYPELVEKFNNLKSYNLDGLRVYQKF